ncbi:1-phosphatidylinositol 4,5-bisphosphate phosphodiesterase 1-like protein [Cladobotryum mycophilum]|uniref:Phosphoinositide phospholipase C n=1 Tax=Cladobotryum mycophilum TaxID=491253 RepID=A0ABR0SCT7_9HYPO
MAPTNEVVDLVHQGGGGNAYDQRAIHTIDGKVLAYLKRLFETHAGPDGIWNADQIRTFIQSVQHEGKTSPATAHFLSHTGIDFNGFLSYMTSADSNITLPPNNQDLSWPLASYFISSSHNTYLSGNQLSSASTTDAYTNVLLRGCRCVEIDVWDGDDSDSETSDSDTTDDEKAGKRVALKEEKAASGEKKKKSAWDTLSKLKNKLPDSVSSKKTGEKLDGQQTPSVVEPRVLHGYTLTKDISFRNVCVAIRDSAFTVTDLPLMVSLEVHCSAEQQAIMVDIMKETWGGMLIEAPNKDAAELPSPEKIESVADEQPPADAAKQPKPSKIIAALSKLGIYTKAISFKAWAQPEASIPTHIFSLSEKKFLDHHENQWLDLFNHNRSYLLRAYPSGLRIGSSNLNPAVFWGGGAQVVALNWQQTDEGMMLNEGMFAGTGGYVLKPEGYRPNIPSKPSPNTITRKSLSLTLTFLAAQSIPLPPDEKSPKGFKPYVKVELHVDASEKSHSDNNDGHVREGEYKARTKTHRGCDLDLKAEKLEFKNIAGLVEELTFVRFTVRDDEIGKDDLAAWACVRLDRLGEGYRFITLMDTTGEVTDGVVLLKVEKTLV